MNVATLWLERTWHFHWRTTSWGRRGELRALAASAPHYEGARVEYAYGDAYGDGDGDGDGVGGSGGLSEWYVNRSEGLEQGFQVARRPEGAGRLLIRGEIGGGLSRLRLCGCS